jgi:hypothetical protein
MLRIVMNTYCYILFLHIGSSSLLKYAKQNIFYICVTFLFVVTNAARIHLTKNKKMFLDF